MNTAELVIVRIFHQSPKVRSSPYQLNLNDFSKTGIVDALYQLQTIASKDVNEVKIKNKNKIPSLKSI